MFTSAPAPRFLLLTDDPALIARFKDQIAPLTNENGIVVRSLPDDLPDATDSVKPDLIVLDLRTEYDTAHRRLRSTQMGWPTVSIFAVVDSANIYLELTRQCETLREFVVANGINGQELYARVFQIIRRQRAKQASRRELSLLEALMANLPDHIYFKDLQSRFIRVNQRYADDFGIGDPNEIIGKTDFDLFSPEHAQEAFADEMRIIRTGEPMVSKPEHISYADGTMLWTSSTKLPLRNADGAIVGTMGLSRVITEMIETQQKLKATIQELRDTQKQLIEAEKLKTVGRMAAGIAHEVKNPLGIISMGLQYLDEGNRDAQDFEETMADMREAVQRASTVISDLLDYSAPNNAELAHTSINDLIQHTLRMTHRTLTQENVRVRIDLAHGLPSVLADGNKMEQVFLNLILNACHAMPQGGEIKIRTYADRLKSPGKNQRDLLELFTIGERVVIIEVTDTGPGIPDELLAKVFEPFVTSKNSVDGAGLGLTVTKHIMDLHHGAILLENQPEGGLRAQLILPIKETTHA